MSLGVSQMRSEDKMAAHLQMMTLLFYHSPIFSLIMMRVGAEDWELGQSISLLPTSCRQGELYGARSSDSYSILVGALIAVLWMVLERLISLEVQLVMIQGRKLKNRRARNIGIMMGISQENHCEMLFPRRFQESFTSLLHFSVS
jgi:hypothetical protein